MQLLASDQVRPGHGAMTSEEEQPPADFFTEIVLSVTQLAAIGWNGNTKRDLGQKMTTSDL